MSGAAEGVVIVPLVLPESLDSPDAADFRAVVDLNNALCLLETGVPDLSRTAEEMLPGWADRTDRAHDAFLARRGDEIVGAAVLITSTDASATSAELDIMVLPAHRGRGVEQALLSSAERHAVRLGRRTLHAWTLHRAETSARMLTPATGWGRVPATALTDLLSAHGFTLEQVERNSTLALTAPLGDVERLLAHAHSIAGGEYRLMSWTLPTPPALRAGFAEVISRMATDAPSGDLEIDEETWDAARVERRDARFAEGGQLVSVAAVEHVPTGRLVAYNELVIGADRSGVTHQFGTLVVKEHRGRRLGTIVKCANLLRWREIAPDSPKVSTFNAEENRPMLDINEEIGFVPVSYAAAWQKALIVDAQPTRPEEDHPRG